MMTAATEAPEPLVEPSFPPITNVLCTIRQMRRIAEDHDLFDLTEERLIVCTLRLTHRFVDHVGALRVAGNDNARVVARGAYRPELAAKLASADLNGSLIPIAVREVGKVDWNRGVRKSTGLHRTRSVRAVLMTIQLFVEFAEDCCDGVSHSFCVRIHSGRFHVGGFAGGALVILQGFVFGFFARSAYGHEIGTRAMFRLRLWIGDRDATESHYWCR